MYMTLFAGSPCAKMVSFPRNLDTILPRPADSRNSCTSKTGRLESTVGGGRRSLAGMRRVGKDLAEFDFGSPGEAPDVVLIIYSPIAVNQAGTRIQRGYTLRPRDSVLQME